MNEPEESRRSAFRRWWHFLRERFPPGPHLIMIATFWAGNLAAGAVLAKPAASTMPACLGFVLCVLFFFRLRVFDEIKDFGTDREQHPDRPLARGLIGLAEAKAMAAGTLAVEGMLAVLAGWPMLLAWGVAAGFSGLMYREFFAGAWLRPKMELYAIAHTFVAALLGQMAMVAATGLDWWRLGWVAWLAALGNWAVFNVYEFARKTHGVEEEAAGVESYSKRWSPLGAGLLSLVNAAAACGLLFATLSLWTRPALVWPAALWWLAAALALALYARRPDRRRARLLRAVMTFFQLGYYLLPVSLAILLHLSRTGAR